MNKADLKLDWCNHAAAKYAVERWHYSQSLPTPPLVKVGVWEAGRFIGCVLFGRGANNNMYKPYGVTVTQACELTRVALSRHRAQVTRIITLAIRLLRKSNPGLRLIVSYADPNRGHAGGIYQGGNWIYTGKTSSDFKAIDRTGREWHSRQVSRNGIKKQYGQARRVPMYSECEIVPLEGKHRYLMPLDEDMRARILLLAKPYPKRAASIDSDAVANQATEGGASPTAALQN
jgi:hypothetical protein